MAVIREPRLAADYDGRTAEAVKSVLVEIGQILGSYREKFAVIGGAVPWLLMDQTVAPHIGTADIDLSLDPVALGDGEYADLVTALLERGYRQSEELKKFQLVREIQPAEGPPVEVIVDFLMPRSASVEQNDPPLVGGFAVQKADGADLALLFSETVPIIGMMPAGGRNSVELKVCSIEALLAMKGFALQGRYKEKDAYDIYYCIRNFAGGIEALAARCRPVLALPTGAKGYGLIEEKFAAIDGFGPSCVRQFVEETDALDGRTADEWQQDAFGQVDAWCRALGLR